jgi:glucose/arabinose dehydrogenase
LLGLGTAAHGPFDHTRDTHGNQASFRRGFDGWLYATHGFNNDSHVTARDGSHVDLNSGNTYRIRLDGSRIEHHTHGQVNPFGLAWDARGNL